MSKYDDWQALRADTSRKWKENIKEVDSLVSSGRLSEDSWK